MLNSPLYNPFAEAHASVIAELLAMGHEVGLHYDGSPAHDFTAVAPLRADVDKQAAMFERYFGTMIRSVSFHRPTQALLVAQVDLGDRINTYAPRYFQDYWYVSDSSRRWRRGCACRSIPVPPERSVQLLVHPEWWGDADVPKQERLWQLLSLRWREADQALAQHITDYVRFLPE